MDLYFLQLPGPIMHVYNYIGLYKDSAEPTKTTAVVANGSFGIGAGLTIASARAPADKTAFAKAGW